MADTFSKPQATRLFGFIMAGGSIGAILAPSVTRLVVGEHGATGVMLVSVGALLMATLLAVLLGKYARSQQHNHCLVRHD